MPPKNKPLFKLENNLRLAKINLAQLLNITDYEDFAIEMIDVAVPFSEVMGESPKAIYVKSLSFRNDIKLADTNVEIAETDIALAKGNMQPRLSAFYGYSTRLSYADRLRGTGEFTDVPIGFVRSTGEVVNTRVEEREVVAPLPIADQLGLNDGHNFGIQLSIPIFNAFSAKNNLKRSRINLERTKNQKEQQQLDLETNINQAYNDAKGAFTFYEAAQRTSQTRLNAFENAHKTFWGWGVKLVWLCPN